MGKKEKKEKKGFWKEFKEFISRGNVMDMAVGIIVGGAFTAIITALVDNILTPLLQWVGVSSDGTGALQIVLREAVVDASGAVTSEAIIMDFGIVISAIVSFLLTAFVLFLIIRAMNRFKAKAEELKAKREAEETAAKATEEVAEPAPEPAPEPEPAPAPAAPTTEELLAEIRDLLKTQNCAESAKDDVGAASAKEE